MKTWGEVGVQLHAFLTSALDGGEWSDLRPGRFTSERKNPGSHWVRVWMGPRAGFDPVAIQRCTGLTNSVERESFHKGRIMRFVYSRKIYRLCVVVGFLVPSASPATVPEVSRITAPPPGCLRRLRGSGRFWAA
jgi:hypothetical protein